MTESLSQPNLPWASIYTLSEPEGVERTIHGIVYVWTEDRSLYANAGRSLLRIGDTRMPLWCHSLLNPFLLMTLLPTLKAAYPALSASHWAMLMGNGQAKQQQALLEEIITIGQLDPGKLQADMGVGSAHHPAGQQGCMGLHVAAELYRKALGSDTQPAHALLLELLAYLLNRDDFSESTEYCPLPTLALSAVEIAQLYHALILPLPRDLIRQCPDELTECLECWNEIAGLMREHPASMGGPDGLDTQPPEPVHSAYRQSRSTWAALYGYWSQCQVCRRIGDLHSTRSRLCCRFHADYREHLAASARAPDGAGKPCSGIAEFAFSFRLAEQCTANLTSQVYDRVF
jgi:hypothetical protein